MAIYFEVGRSEQFRIYGSPYKINESINWSDILIDSTYRYIILSIIVIISDGIL